MSDFMISTGMKREFLCSLCVNIFRDPRVLSCGHTFCLSCLEAVSEETGDEPIRCPDCNDDFALPPSGKMEHLARNHCLISVLRTLNISQDFNHLSLNDKNNNDHQLFLQCNVDGKYLPSQNYNGSLTISSKNSDDVAQDNPDTEINGFHQHQEILQEKKVHFVSLLEKLTQHVSEIKKLLEQTAEANVSLVRNEDVLKRQVDEAAKSFLSTITKKIDNQKTAMKDQVGQISEEKQKDIHAVIESAKVLKATVLSAKEVTSSIIAAIERDDVNVTTGTEMEGGMENMINNVEKKLCVLQKKTLSKSLGLYFNQQFTSDDISIGYLDTLIQLVAVVCLSKEEIVLVADKRQDNDTILLRCTSADDVSDVRWEQVLQPKETRCPITVISNTLLPGVTIVGTGSEIFKLRLQDIERKNVAVLADIESKGDLVFPKDSYISAITVRHDEKILVSTNNSTIINIYNKDFTANSFFDISKLEWGIGPPVSMCSTKYYRTALCCHDNSQVTVVSHDWDGTTVKQVAYLLPAANSEYHNLICKIVKCSLSGWIALWVTRDQSADQSNDLTNDAAVVPSWEIVQYEFMSSLMRVIARGTAEETGAPVGIDTLENLMVICFENGKANIYEV